MPRDPEHIEDAIEHTRERIEGRLGDLVDQISPSRMINSLFRSDAESPMEMAENLVRRARDNPVPALLIGAGLAGLVLGSRSAASGHERYRSANGAAPAARPSSVDPAERIAENASHLKAQASELRDNISDAVSNLRDSAKAGVEKAGDAASGAIGDASDYVSDTRASVSQKSAELRQRAGDLASDVGSRVETTKTRIGHELRQTRMRADSAAEWVRENPLPAGLAALAIGAAAASMFAARRSNEGVSEEAYRPLPPHAKAASHSLHREAREAADDPHIRGAERFNDLSDAARAGKSSKSANTRKGRTSSAAASGVTARASTKKAATKSKKTTRSASSRNTVASAKTGKTASAKTPGGK